MGRGNAASVDMYLSKRDERGLGSVVADAKRLGDRTFGGGWCRKVVI